MNWADQGQRVLMRRGPIAQIRRGRLAFVAEVSSLAHVLGQTVGRTFQTSCDAALGDARCGVDLDDPAYKGTGAVVDLLRDRALSTYGNRLPQLSFEVFRPLADSDTAEGLTRAVTMIPAWGELTYATQAIRKDGGATVSENLNALADSTW